MWSRPIERYLAQLDKADRTESPPDHARTLQDKVAKLREEMARLKKLEVRMLEASKPRTSPNRAEGQFDRAAFKYVAGDDEYECPAGERLIYRFTRT